MRLIESKALGTSQASIEFTSIPQTFTDLVVLYSLRNTGTNGSERVFSTRISFNGSTSDFTARALFGTTSTGSFSTTNRFVGWHPDSAATSNTFGNTSIYIANYTGSTNKSFSIDSVTENNEALVQNSIVASLWSNTAAINSLTLTPEANNFAAGSIVSLYGVLKGSDGIVTTSP